MKKTLLSIIFVLILVLVPTMVYAAEEAVAKVGENTYATLKEALDVADGKEVILLQDAELSTKYEVKNNENLTINLGGFNISGDAKPLFAISNGSVKVKGTGTITAKGDAFYVGNTITDESSKKAEVEISANVNVVAGECGIFIKGNGAKAEIYGSLTSTGKYAVIQGNGTVGNGNTVINVYDGAEIINENSPAIFHPQSGKITVLGGTIKGTTGIEMRAGELVVENGTITGTAENLTVKPNGSGSTTIGAGIAIAQHTTKLNTSVVINGGNIQGYSAVYESNPQDNDAEAIDKVSIAINGGKFETINGGTLAVDSENKTKFITGGTFSSNVSNYVSDYHECNLSGSNYVVQKLHEITVNVKDSVGGTASSDVIRAVEGRNIGLYITPETGYELKEIIITDALGVQTKTTNHYFVMPNSDVTVEVVYSKIVKQEVEIPDVVEDNKKVEDVLLDSLKQNGNFKEVVENNNVKVDVQVSENKVQATEKEEIKEKLEKEGLTVGKYFDITIAVINKDTGVTEGTLNELTEEIKFTITIPEDLPEVEEGFTRKYYIIRNHVGQVEYLQVELSEDGKSLSFETDKFSTYVLAYTDVEIANDNTVDNPTGEVEGETIQQPETNEKDDTPKTGVINISTFIWVAVASIALVAIVKTKKSSKHSK